ncbi:MFS transporter, partial [Campylobacter sp. CH278]
MTEVAIDKAAITTADPEIERTTIRKVALRLMWFVMAMYFLAILDRGNISFA